MKTMTRCVGLLLVVVVYGIYTTQFDAWSARHEMLDALDQLHPSSDVGQLHARMMSQHHMRGLWHTMGWAVILVAGAGMFLDDLGALGASPCTAGHDRLHAPA